MKEDIELDMSTQSYLHDSREYKVRIFFYVGKNDTCSVGLDVRHGKRHTYTTLSREEAEDIGLTLIDYAAKLDEFNKED